MVLDQNIEYITDVLFVISLIISAILGFIAAASLGKQLTDLDYQSMAHLNGIRKIQSFVNLRIHTSRILFALAFVITSVLGLFDADQTLRTIAGRLMFMFLLLYYTISAILDWLGERKQLQILVANANNGNIPSLRAKAHAFGSKLQVLIGVVEILRQNESSVTKDDVIELDIISKELTTQFTDVQNAIRSLDPNYYIRPEMKSYEHNETG